jgi:PAS domain S-box-containing protein
MEVPYARRAPSEDRLAGLWLEGLRAHWRTYALPVAFTATTVVLRYALTFWIGDRPILNLFMIPVVCSAYWGGPAAGLICTLLVALATGFWAIPPTRNVAVGQALDVVPWLCLILAGIFASVLSGKQSAVPSDPDAKPAPGQNVQRGMAVAIATLGVCLVAYLSVAPLHEQRLLISEASPLAQLGLIACGLLAIVFFARELLHIWRERIRRRRAELDLERFFMISLDFLCISSADGYFKRVSPAVTNILGWSVEEFLSKPYMEFVHPDDSAATEAEVRRQVQHGEKALHFENRYRHKDGTWRRLAWRSMPQPDGRMYASARDVTDLRKTERALIEVNEQLEARVRARTGELGHMNEKLSAQLEQLGLLSQVTRAIGRRQDEQSIYQVATRCLEERLLVDFCCICLYDAEANALMVSSIGVRSRSLAAELALEAQSRIEVEASGLAQCIQGRLVYATATGESPSALAQRFARVSLCSMVAAPLLIESKVFGILIAARIGAHGFNQGECEFLRQLSEHVALAANQAQLHTSLQQAYDELRQTQQAVMQQERLLALGQMASGIAHDINNAISPVMIYTDALLEREEGLSARAREYLEVIQRSTGDVAQTVARMREFYRQREPELMLLPVDLNELVRQVLDLTRARWHDIAQQRGAVISVETDLAPELPAILGSESELREALVNLVFNAVDAMPGGGILTLRSVAPDGALPRSAGTVRVEIADSGMGMDETTRAHCLEPFFTTKGERGTGLGLAMVYGSMQRHGAEISLDSTPGTGTTVRLIFPVAQTDADATQSTSAAAVILHRLRILVVDDDSLVVRSLTDALTNDGHVVTSESGGQAGIDTFLAALRQGNPFPLVITDLGMPYVDGRKVAAAVKAAAPATRVFMLTGWGQQLIDSGEIPPGVDRILAKPPKLREVREALASVPNPTRVGATA